MFKKIIRPTSLIFSLAILFQTAAFADTIEGRIAGVSSNTVGMTVYDPQGRPYPNTLDLKVDDRTQINGASSVYSLRPNQAVSAEVRREESGLWRADEITLFQEVNAQPATQNPPPSMKSMLGNPVVRGALLGAATGAIASSASGGKAGKGALVGAGVGAASGLLSGIFGGQGSDSDNR